MITAANQARPYGVMIYAGWHNPEVYHRAIAWAHPRTAGVVTQASAAEPRWGSYINGAMYVSDLWFADPEDQLMFVLMFPELNPKIYNKFEPEPTLAD